MPDGILILRPHSAGAVTQLSASCLWAHAAIVGADSYDVQRYVYFSKLGGLFDKLDLYRWSMPWPMVDQIVSIGHYAVAQRDAYGSINSVLRIAGVDYTEVFPVFTGNPETVGVFRAADPRTGLPWRWEDLTPDYWQWGIHLQAGGSGGGEGEPDPAEGIDDPGGGEGGWATERCFQTWLEIYYEAPGAVGSIQVPPPFDERLT